MTFAPYLIATLVLYSAPGATLADLVRHQTPHFELLHDVDPQDAAAVAGILESTYDAVVGFLKELDLPLRPSPQRLPVRLFAQISDFHREVTAAGHSPDGIVGLYVPESSVTLLLRPESIPAIAALDREWNKAPGPNTAALQTKRDALVERVRRLTIAHEAAHQLLFDLGPLDRAAKQPPWLVEGLACLFEPMTSETDYRRTDLPKDLTMTKLREVIAAASFNGPDAAADYAVAYVLVAHLRRTNPNALAALMTTSPGPALADFERIAGPIDASLLEALTRPKRSGEPEK